MGIKNEYKRTNYPSDLTDEQWNKIAEFFTSGNKSKYDKRNLVEAGKNVEPGYALIDSQSVKTAYRSDTKGYNGGKKRKE